MKFIRKAMAVDKLQDGLLEIDEYFSQRALYKGQISLIAGLPYDNEQTIEKTLHWVNKNWHTRKNSSSMYPLLLKTGEFAEFEQYSDLDNSCAEYGYREMTDEEMKSFYPAGYSRTPQMFYWANDKDKTNFATMSHIATTHIEKTAKDQGLPAWAIPYWRMLKSDEDIDNTVGEPWAHYLPLDFVDKIVSEYISQKL
jgi:hypothetical protein